MKTKKLKIEGDEKIKIELKFDFDEVYITLFEGGRPTKYKDVLTFSKENYDDMSFEVSLIGKIIKKLYDQYLKAKKMETNLIKVFEDRENIEIV